MVKTFKLDHDWDKVYGKGDFAGELVLDVGADRGSTARFFLENGARAVVCSEPSSSVYYRELEAYAILEDRVALVKPVLSQSAAATLLSAWTPDTLKLDCEGCEEYWLQPILDHPPSCVLAEMHSTDIWHRFRGALPKRYSIEVVSQREGDHGEFTVCRADLK